MILYPGRVFDGTRFLSRRYVRVERGVVVEMMEEVPAGEAVLEYPDVALAPGYVDVHIHAIGGHDVMRGQRDVEAIARAVAQHGVTGFCPTTMAAPLAETRAALEGIAAAMETRGGARVLGAHLEGPFLNAARKGAQPEHALIKPTMENYLAIAGGLNHAVRLMTVAPELPLAGELIRALSGQIVLSAGHTIASAEQIEEAAGLGLTQVTHLFNAMNAFSHRAPGVPGAALVDDRLSVQLIADLIHLHRDALKLAWKAKGPEKCLLITDSMEATGLPDGTYDLGGQRVTVKRGEARLDDGTLAGSTLTMDHAVRNMIESVGVPEEEALMMATSTPARSLGLKDIGVIKPGARADLILLDASYRIHETLVGGEVVYRAG